VKHGSVEELERKYGIDKKSIFKNIEIYIKK
jgi:hypothetical protein